MSPFISQHLTSLSLCQVHLQYGAEDSKEINLLTTPSHQSGPAELKLPQKGHLGLSLSGSTEDKYSWILHTIRPQTFSWKARKETSGILGGKGTQTSSGGSRAEAVAFRGPGPTLCKVRSRNENPDPETVGRKWHNKHGDSLSEFFQFQKMLPWPFPWKATQQRLLSDPEITKHERESTTKVSKHTKTKLLRVRDRDPQQLRIP